MSARNAKNAKNPKNAAQHNVEFAIDDDFGITEAIATPPSCAASSRRPIAVVETMPISGVVKLATIAGPAMANTWRVEIFGWMGACMATVARNVCF